MERRPRQSTPVGTGVPWLVFIGCKGQTFCTIGTISTTVELKSIPELRNNEFWACYHGWLLMSSKDYNLWCFWNPITYDFINLPPLPFELVNSMNINSCVFTTSPKNPGCTVMLFDSSTTVMAYCQPGDQNWKTHDYKRDLLEIGVGKDSVCSIRVFACLDSVIYADMLNREMVAIEFDNQTGLIKITSLGLGLGHLHSRMFTVQDHTFFVESFGELYAVCVKIHINWEQIFGIEVLRLDFSRKVWVDVEDLDGRLLFLAGQRNCTSCLATETGIRGNHIYFMVPEDKHLYVYDLEEGTILNSLPCPRLQNPWYESFWMMPEYPHIDDQKNVKPEYKINMDLEQHTQVEVQTPRDMETSADQYPHNIILDMFTEIANNLGPLDYLEFRATCRLFRSAAPATQWSITSIIDALESPWLVTLRYNKSTFSFTDPKHNNTYSMKVPESLQGTYISSSKDGYLVLVDGKTLYYFNPFTSMQVKLPTSLSYDNRLSLSSSPSSSNCLAVKLDDYFTDVDYIRQGEDNWYRVEGFEGDIRGFNVRTPGVFHDGMFYFLGEKGNLGVLKIEDEDEFRWETLVKPEAPCNAFHHTYLMKCNGELMAVFVGRYGNWVKVFRRDPSKMIWVRVSNLGCYTLFISNISSIAAVARSPEMGNKVYFSRFHDQRIVYYSLETEKFHTHGSDIALENFVDTKEQLYSTWIEPAQN